MMSDESHAAGDGDPADADGYFIPAGGGTHREIFPGVRIHAVSGDRLMLSLVDLEPGSVVLEHSHPHEQMGMLISGRVEFTIGGVTKVLGPGEMWRIPGHVPHMVRTLEGPAVALDIFHPVREDYR
jgi:quercetin dioxygenase-like cupin family protein